jgi:hypothetical protein
MRISWLAVAAATLAFCGTANATVVLSDNFASSTPVLNWPGDSTFQSVSPVGNSPNPASVDLVGASNGFANLVVGLAPGAHAVDLDGSTGSGNTPLAGDLQSVQSLAEGNYTVQFELAGNLRSAPSETTVVSIGSTSITLPAVSNTQPYTLYNLTFTGVSGHLSFEDLGPSDQIGNLLANVIVYAPGPVPGTGLAGLAALALAGLYTRARRA